MATIKGIDVSKWNEDINWSKVKAAGIKFAMIRLGYGSPNGDIYGVDKYFEKNVKGATEAGIDIGCYFYSYAKSVAAAQKEAEYVVSILNKYKGVFTYPIAFDLEDDSQLNLGETTLTNMVINFCNIIKEVGFYPSLYSNLNWLRNYLDTNKFKDLDIWLAQWASAPTYTNSFGMWQYSASGIVNGINGNVDMNLAYIDYPNIIKSNGYNGFNNSTIIKGDINNDGKVTAADARLASRAAVDLEKLTNAQVKAGDMDNDGRVTAADARLIMRKAIGLDDDTIIKGDIDSDGKVTAADARLANRAAVGLEKLNDKQKKAGDMDNDGKITSADARSIMRKILDLD